jgi:hypothetical protein
MVPVGTDATGSAGTANLAKASDTDSLCWALLLSVGLPELDDVTVSASIYFVGKAESRFSSPLGASLNGLGALPAWPARKVSLRMTCVPGEISHNCLRTAHLFSALSQISDRRRRYLGFERCCGTLSNCTSHCAKSLPEQ